MLPSGGQTRLYAEADLGRCGRKHFRIAHSEPPVAYSPKWTSGPSTRAGSSSSSSAGSAPLSGIPPCMSGTLARWASRAPQERHACGDRGCRRLRPGGGGGVESPTPPRAPLPCCARVMQAIGSCTRMRAPGARGPAPGDDSAARSRCAAIGVGLPLRAAPRAFRADMRLVLWADHEATRRELWRPCAPEHVGALCRLVRGGGTPQAWRLTGLGLMRARTAVRWRRSGTGCGLAPPLERGPRSNRWA